MIFMVSVLFFMSTFRSFRLYK